jgi:hypothetical protein
LVNERRAAWAEKTSEFRHPHHLYRNLGVAGESGAITAGQRFASDFPAAHPFNPPMIRRSSVAAAIFFVVNGVFGAAPSDPLAEEIARWSAYVRDHPAGSEDWEQIKGMSEPVLAKAEDALAAGRRELALDRLAVVRVNLAASQYAEACPEAMRAELSAFEAEWTRMGTELGDALAPPTAAVLAGVVPSATRAEGEAALLQVRGFYEASLDYGRATMPEAGLFYLGQAKAQKSFAAFCRALPAVSTGKPPELRSIAPELDALSREFLAAYRPPASIDKHSEFIVAHSLLNEARALDAAGLRYGALLRYLQAAMRSGALRDPRPAPDADAIAASLAPLAARLEEKGVDHSIGRLFLEVTQNDVAGFTPVIVRDVLPRYFAAIAPAKAPAKSASPRVTVTLVRWPYT